MAYLGNELRIEVMQLSSPNLHNSVSIPNTIYDLIENPVLANINSVQNDGNYRVFENNKTANIYNSFNDFSKLLILPNKLAASYLGETFKICCSIRLALFESIIPVVDLSIKVVISMDNKNHTTLYKSEKMNLSDYNETIDFVASYDLKSAGVYRLNILCNYNINVKNILDNGIDPQPKVIKKNYDIKVTSPIKISLDYPYLDSKTILADTKIENVSKTDMVLTEFGMIAVEPFVLLVNNKEKGSNILLKPQESCKKAFALKLKNNLPIIAGKHKYGKLTIVWNRKMSQVGKLYSNVLDISRMPELKFEINFKEEKLEKESKNLNKISLLKPVEVFLSIINTSFNEMALSMQLKENSFLDPIKFIGKLIFDQFIVGPGEEYIINSKFLSTKRGMHIIPKILVKDMNSKNVWAFENIRNVFVE